MRIAFYTDTYLPNRDGVVTSIINFRKELERRGHEVYIFASGSRKAKRENEDPHVFYHASTPFRPYPQYRIALFPFLSERKVRSLKMDVIHSHGMATMGLAADRAAHDLKIPYVGTMHTLIPQATHYVSKFEPVRKAAERIAWGYLKLYYNRCDAVTAPSRVIKEVMEEHGIRNVRVLPNGIDAQRFNPGVGDGPIRDWWNLRGKKVVMHLGRLVLEKNLEVLIKAALFIAEEEPDVKFLIVGTGPAAAHYKELVRRNHVDRYFVFTGFVEDRWVPGYYACADAVVVPSKFETQGLVTLEAMACGKPVAGADFLATKEIVSEGKDGFLFDPDDPEDCAEKVVAALRTGGKMGEAARRKAEEYSVEKCTDRLLALYGELV